MNGLIGLSHLPRVRPTPCGRYTRNFRSDGIPLDPGAAWDLSSRMAGAARILIVSRSFIQPLFGSAADRLSLTCKIGAMTDRAILEHISRLPHARANFKQLVRELGAKGDQREELEAALARLAARGDLIELRSGHFVVTARSREFAVGRSTCIATATAS